MKYLSHYVEQKQTDLFDRTGAFFAFSTKQFDEKKQPGVVYSSLGVGLIAPKANASELLAGLKTIHAEGVAADIEENGKPAIIQRELANHEAQITRDVSSTVDALEGYDITVEEVQAGYSTFFQTCVDNDWF